MPRSNAAPPTAPTIGPMRLVWLLLGSENTAALVGVILGIELDAETKIMLVEGMTLELLVIGSELEVGGTLDMTVEATGEDKDVTAVDVGVFVDGGGDGAVVVGAFVVVEVVAGGAFVVVVVGFGEVAVSAVVVVAAATAYITPNSLPLIIDKTIKKRKPYEKNRATLEGIAPPAGVIFFILCTSVTQSLLESVLCSTHGSTNATT